MTCKDGRTDRIAMAYRPFTAVQQRRVEKNEYLSLGLIDASFIVATNVSSPGERLRNALYLVNAARHKGKPLRASILGNLLTQNCYYIIYISINYFVLEIAPSLTSFITTATQRTNVYRNSEAYANHITLFMRKLNRPSAKPIIVKIATPTQRLAMFIDTRQHAVQLSSEEICQHGSRKGLKFVFGE